MYSDHEGINWVSEQLLHIWFSEISYQGNRFVFLLQIYIRSVDMLVNKEIQVNSTMEDVYIHHLQRNVTYQLQMSAFNHIGESAASEVIWIGKSELLNGLTDTLEGLVKLNLCNVDDIGSSDLVSTCVAVDALHDQLNVIVSQC